MRCTSVFVILLTCAASSSLAQLPHLGTWAIDRGNSDGGEQVWEFIDLGSGLWEFQMNGRRIFHFRMDDEECVTCEASFYTWEIIGPKTYLTSFVGPWARDIVKISVDDDSLSFIQKRPGATGELEDHVETFQRFSGGPGLAGTWVAEFDYNLSPAQVDLRPGDGEWFIFKWTGNSDRAQEWVCVLLLNGADYPCFNALAEGRTIGMKLIDPRTLDAVFKVNGDRDAESAYTVWPDGTTLIRTQPSITGGSIETVYERR